MDAFQLLEERAHIQDFHSGQAVEHHWGYADRIVPCTSDAGSCEYLDTVYHSHDLGMTYTWILWVVLLSVFLIIVALRFLSLPRKSSTAQSPLRRAYAALTALLRRHLLPETRLPGLWSHTTRLQVLILVIFLAYLTVFSLVGITYKTWITPVKKSPSLYNIRSALGPWADRVGVLAYAITPLAVFLSARESILSLATGIPSQHFIFLHAWIGRIIFIQSFLHTLGWTLVEGRFYQPQPYAYTSVMSEQYIIFGCVAMFLLTVLYIFSLKRIVAWTGHEIFRKVHYLVALLYLGACWGHWVQLSGWMIASLIVVLLDRALRLLRVVLLHLGRGSEGNGNLLDIYPFQAKASTFTDAIDGRTVVRLEVAWPRDGKKRISWHPGQHFYVCFPEFSLWQSHPFTVANVQPSTRVSRDGEGSVREKNKPGSDSTMTFILRTQAGQTSRLLSWAKSRQANTTEEARTLSVVLTGPYGVPVLSIERQQNVLAVAAGTGVTYTLPLAIQAAENRSISGGAVLSQVEHIWIVREAHDIAWLPEEELSTVRRLVAEGKLIFRVFVTRQTTSTPPSLPNAAIFHIDGIKQSPVQIVAGDSNEEDAAVSAFGNFEITRLAAGRPDLSLLVDEYTGDHANSDLRSKVVASGPAGMLAAMRRAVAQANRPERVWRDELKWDVELWCDDRLG